MRRFQLNSSKLFLTYPEADPCTLQQIYYDLTEKFEHSKLLVAEERHQNGNLHFHCYIELQSALRTTDPRFADLKRPDGTVLHGNYQGCRSAKNVVKYCTKEDNFLSTFDVNELLPKSTSRTKVFGTRIMQGEDFMEVLKDFPEYIKGYARLKQDVEQFQKDMQEKGAVFELPAELPNPWNKTFLVDTDNKKCHFWFHSQIPNKGKTTGVIEPLLRNHNAYLFNPKGTYHEIRKSTKVICIDEFSIGQMKAQSLNTLCDGYYKFRIFMGGEIQLDEKPLVVICSNFSINEVFPYMNNLVHARFYEYDVSMY